jgi:FSR family fosmidomycin resistance protein-like MFS transporter
MPFHRSPVFRIAVLIYAHFTVDFAGGLLLPLPDPTLIVQYQRSLADIMLVISGSALLVNLVQPMAGYLLAGRSIPGLLFLCPSLAALTALIGLSSQYWIFGVLLVLSGLGIGLLHPEGAATLQSLSTKRIGFATSAFMAAGFLGFSLGSLIGGWWAAHWGLAWFWILLLPGLAASILIRLSQADRVAHIEPISGINPKGRLPFSLVLPLSILIACSLGIIYRLIPIYYVRRFGAEAQADAGTLLFLIGLSGTAGTFLWGFLSDRFGCGRLLALVYLVGAPWYYGIVGASSPEEAVIPAILFGFTIGGSFPLSIVLARKASSPSLRLRLGLCIGGAWGTGELLVILASRYIDRFPSDSFQGISDVLLLPWGLMAAVIVAALVTIVWEPN